MNPPEIEKSQVLNVTSTIYRQARKTIIILLWLLVIVVIIAYIFQIWNAVATIHMLQTASPNDPFKENNGTYQLYKNLAIGSVVMSTLALILVFFLVGTYYTYFNSMKRMFQIINVSTEGAAPILIANAKSPSVGAGGKSIDPFN